MTWYLLLLPWHSGPIWAPCLVHQSWNIVGYATTCRWIILPEKTTTTSLSLWKYDKHSLLLNCANDRVTTCEFPTYCARCTCTCLCAIRHFNLLYIIYCTEVLGYRWRRLPYSKSVFTRTKMLPLGKMECNLARIDFRFARPPPTKLSHANWW